MTPNVKSDLIAARALIAVAKAICQSHGYAPDKLESGDALGIDGHLPNNDPAHFMWREFTDEATAAVDAYLDATDPPTHPGEPIEAPIDTLETFVIDIACQSGVVKAERNDAQVETTATGVRWHLSGKLGAAVRAILSAGAKDERAQE